MLLVLAVLTWMRPAAAAGAMRCDGRIIQEGALQIEVLGACGEPAYRDVWIDEQEWYYNFGSNQLLQVLRLRNGRVVNIDIDGYGFEARVQRVCNPLDITPGLSKYRLWHLCGEPATRRSRSVLAPEPPQRRMYPGQVYTERYHASPYLTAVFREEWVYNFGSSYLLRIVTLENGRVSDVQNGNRGFD